MRGLGTASAYVLCSGATLEAWEESSSAKEDFSGVEVSLSVTDA